MQFRILAFILLLLPSVCPAQTIQMNVSSGYTQAKLKAQHCLPAKGRGSAGNLGLILDFKHFQTGLGVEVGHISGFLLDSTRSNVYVQNIYYTPSTSLDVLLPYYWLHLHANAKLPIITDRLYLYAGPLAGRLIGNTKYTDAGLHIGWKLGGQAGIVVNVSDGLGIELSHSMRFFTIKDQDFPMSSYSDITFESISVRSSHTRVGIRVRFKR